MMKGEYMFQVTDTASQALTEAIANASKKGHLVIYLQGMACSGPALGLALDENIEGLEKLESNGITAYIAPRVRKYLAPYGEINIDFVDHEGQQGFVVKAGDGTQGGCSCGSSSCG